MNCVIGADELFNFIQQAFGDEVELFEFFKYICLSREISRRQDKMLCKQLSDVQAHQNISNSL